MSRLNSCWYKILTASGPGAVAVIELTCHVPEMSQTMLRRMTTANAIPVAGVAIGRICYGRWNNEDLIVVRTSEFTWEIQCHGGSVAVNQFCRDLRDDGAVESIRLSDPPGNDPPAGHYEYVQQLVQRVVETQLAHARSRKTAGLILAQASNSLCHDLNVVLGPRTKVTPAATSIRQRLSEWQDVADHLTKPWRVVLAGAPNVGKSSLMNAIAGMDRSIVSDQPGTTRDVVEVDTVIEGWPFRFVDTAGLRENCTDHIEVLGIQQSYLATAQCDVLCVVVDGNPNVGESQDWLSVLQIPKHTILVRNKSDLLMEENTLQSPLAMTSSPNAFPTIKVSALTGEGLQTLLRCIKASVVPHEPTCDTALPLIGCEAQIGRF